MYVVMTILTIAINVWAAVADFMRARFVLANSAELGIAEKWVLPLGLLKAAGAAGLVLGLMGVRPIGVTAAVGLVLFFAGALFVHVRARVFHNIAIPGVFFLMAVASLITAFVA
jgi:hypothetical protein